MSHVLHMLRKPLGIARALREPSCAFRPSQMVRRIGIGLGIGVPAGARARSILPWGLPIEYHRNEFIGHTIFVSGVYDLPVCEALWRLADPGEAALDVGANIGQMTSLLAARVGPGGSVIAYEPNPMVGKLLLSNVAQWHQARGVGRIEVVQAAVSDRAGAAVLVLPRDFAVNQGAARLSDSATPPADAVDQVEVPTYTLDDEQGRFAHVGVMKLDVENHERQVLAGAEQLLRAHRIRDIVFEHTDRHPGPVTGLLEAAGYTLFQMHTGFWGLRLSPLGATEPPHRPGDGPPSLLATLEPDRAVQRFGRRGWTVLRAPKLREAPAAVQAPAAGAVEG